MKTQNYRLQNELEHLTSTNQKEWFKDYLKDVLESGKPYYMKRDYIALSFLELDNKLEYLTDEIKTLTLLKKKLTEAKKIGLEIAAETLTEYGINKMEGTAISSLTISPKKTKYNNDIRIKDPSKVMELGFVNFTVDMKAVEKALQVQDQFEELDTYVDVTVIEEIIPPRLKINKKRNIEVPVEQIELLDEPNKEAA